MPNKDINIKVEAQGADQAKRRLDDIGRSGKKMGEEVAGAQRDISRETGKANEKTEEAKRKTGGLSKIVDGLKNSVLGMVAAWLSIEGVLRILEAIEGRFKKIAEAQRELALSSTTLGDATKALAVQANIIGEPGWEAAAKAQIMELQKQTGLPVGMVSEVAVGTHSAFGTSGQLLSEAQLGIAGEVGRLARMKELSGGEANELMKLMSAMGVQNAEQARFRLQQLSTVQQQSKAATFGEFITGATKAMIPQMAQGASVEFALSGYASALDVTTSGDIAAEQTKQMGALLQNEKVVAALAAQAGVSPQEFRELPYNQRSALLSAWIAQEAATGAGQQRLTEAGISADQLGRAMTLYSPGQLRRQEMFYGLASKARAEDYVRQQRAYEESVVGRIESYGAKAERHRMSASDYMRIGESIIEASEEEWKNIVAKKQDWWWVYDKYERPRRTIWEPMVERAKRLKNPAARQSILSYLQRNQPTAVTDFTAEEIGRAESMLRQAEALEAEQEVQKSLQSGALGGPFALVGAAFGAALLSDVEFRPERTVQVTNYNYNQFPRTDPVESMRNDPNDLSY